MMKMLVSVMRGGGGGEGGGGSRLHHWQPAPAADATVQWQNRQVGC